MDATIRPTNSTYTMETMTKLVAWCMIDVSLTNSHSRIPTGSIDATVTPATTGKGISRSVKATCWPSWRARKEVSESLMPLMMGPMIFNSVQTAATAIAPAPMKRTSLEKDVSTMSARASEPLSPSTNPEVFRGRRTTKEMIRPTIMAMPTDMPTKWPTPINASEREPPMVVAPAPTLK